ncbi:hypothetical protein [Rickettsia endosymbiont of Seladonia tumulorum]|uniref:hypothetical protein n=1 Tax=Rickettsia endosymbiont of Seladonia tumulorum TaxID=3066270 RepID=UPI00313AFA9B
MQRNNATLFTAPIFLELVAQDSKYLKTDFFPMATHTAVSQARGIAYSYPLELPNSYFMDYDTYNVTQIFNLIYTKKVLQEKEIDSIKLQEIQAFLGSIGKLKNYPANLIKVLEENLHNLIPHFGSRPEQYLLLFKEALLKKTIFSKKVKDLIENTFFEFQKILPKLDSFLVKVQADLKKDIKKIIPEILQILCAKIKEWYNIDAPEYITNVKTVEELKNKEVLKDITAKINNSNSIFSQSGDKLKFSIPPIKRKLVSTENINNKLLKTHNEENYDSSLDDAIKEYYKIMGEDSSSISL